MCHCQSRAKPGAGPLPRRQPSLCKLNTSTPADHPLLLFVTQGHGRHLKMQNRHPAPTTSPCGFSARNTGVACEVCGHAQWREGRNSCGQQRNTTLVKLNMLKNRLHLAFEMGIGNQLAIGLGEPKRNETKTGQVWKMLQPFQTAQHQLKPIPTVLWHVFLKDNTPDRDSSGHK